jgi:hypothetical protein
VTLRRRARRPGRDERGIALSSPIALLSAAAVVLAGIAFITTGSDKPDQPATVAKKVRGTPTPTATPTKAAHSQSAKPTKKKTHHRPAVRRSGVYVEVYNNSGIHGLAERTAQRASGAGWEVVGADNWYGTIPQSTVYYPSRLHAQAKLLAHDLGIHRLRPAISPMKFDRLTVILTAGYA